MRRILSFGAYTFPDSIPERGTILQTNFSNGVPRTDRLPGMNGGYDALGDDPFPAEVGSVRYRFVLVADTPAEMADKIDDVMEMSRYGRAVLTMETQGGDERFCSAKVNNIGLPIEADVYSERIVEVTVDWQVANPRWFSNSPDSPQVQACSGTNTTFTVTNDGNATATPIISIDPGVGGISASGLTIQRIVSAVVVDEITYAAALLATEVLSINCQTLTVRKNGTDAYGTAFSADHPAWMRLLPGGNSIKVILGGGEIADVTFTFDDTWH